MRDTELLVSTMHSGKTARLNSGPRLRLFEALEGKLPRFERNQPFHLQKSSKSAQTQQLWPHREMHSLAWRETSPRFGRGRRRGGRFSFSLPFLLELPQPGEVRRPFADRVLVHPTPDRSGPRPRQFEPLRVDRVSSGVDDPGGVVPLSFLERLYDLRVRLFGRRWR